MATYTPPLASASPDSFFFPFEGNPHLRTLLAYPSTISLPENLLDPVRKEIVGLAQAISAFEPVHLYVHPNDVGELRSRISRSENVIKAITLVPFLVHHCWVRDTGPVYVFKTDGDKTRYALNFNFNEWGGKVVKATGNNNVWGQKWPVFDDATIEESTSFAARVIDSEAHAVRRVDSKLILEGGGLITDGDGTLLITESCAIHNGRNPGWSKSDIEFELKRMLGVSKVIWFPGAKNVDITDCHVDAMVRFIRPGILVESRPHISAGKIWTEIYEVTRKIIDESTDARGRKFEITTLDDPEVTPFLTKEGDEMVASRVNWYMVNGGVIVGRFGDERKDREAAEILQKLWPDRKIVMVDIHAIGLAGGGFHCCTQQVPCVPV